MEQAGYSSTRIASIIRDNQVNRTQEPDRYEPSIIRYMVWKGKDVSDRRTGRDSITANVRTQDAESISMAFNSFGPLGSSSIASSSLVLPAVPTPPVPAEADKPAPPIKPKRKAKAKSTPAAEAKLEKPDIAGHAEKVANELLRYVGQSKQTCMRLKKVECTLESEPEAFWTKV